MPSYTPEEMKQMFGTPSTKGGSLGVQKKSFSPSEMTQMFPKKAVESEKGFVGDMVAGAIKPIAILPLHSASLEWNEQVILEFCL